jgi:hypothetical protein
VRAMSNNGCDHKDCRLYVFAGAKSCEHDMQMVRNLADRICVLDYGRTIAAGEPEANLESFRSRGVKNGRTGSAESPVLTPARTFNRLPHRTRLGAIGVSVIA